MDKLEVSGNLICFTWEYNHYLQIDKETKLILVKYQKLHPELADPSEFEIFGPVTGHVSYQNTKLRTFEVDLKTKWDNFHKISDLNQFFDEISETIKRQMTNLTANCIKELQQNIIKREANRVEVIDKVNAAKSMHDLINLLKINLD